MFQEKLISLHFVGHRGTYKVMPALSANIWMKTPNVRLNSVTELICEHFSCAALNHMLFSKIGTQLLKL